MKIKIWITPLMIVAIIYLIIWVAVPAYSGDAGVTVANEKLNQDETKLATITVKEENANKLVTALNNNSEQQKILWQYLPEKKTDEDVIANINSLASKSSLFLTSITLEHEIDTPIAAPVADVAADGSAAPVIPKIEPRKFRAQLSLSGDYDKLRQFMADMSGLKRFNKMVSLKISQNSSAVVGVGSLQADMTIEFNYLNKVGSIESMSSDVFAKGEFDMSVIKKITDKTNVDILKVDAGSVGRTNPFKQ
jgi:Tfp pilus assembly protein PilO